MHYLRLATSKHRFSFLFLDLFLHTGLDLSTVFRLKLSNPCGQFAVTLTSIRSLFRPLYTWRNVPSLIASGFRWARYTMCKAKSRPYRDKGWRMSAKQRLFSPLHGSSFRILHCRRSNSWWSMLRASWKLVATLRVIDCSYWQRVRLMCVDSLVEHAFTNCPVNFTGLDSAIRT